MKQTLILILFLACPMLFHANNPDSAELTMLVGTYTDGSSTGIYSFRFNTKDLSAQPLSQATLNNPSYLAISTFIHDDCPGSSGS